MDNIIGSKYNIIGRRKQFRFVPVILPGFQLKAMQPAAQCTMQNHICPSNLNDGLYNWKF